MPAEAERGLPSYSVDVPLDAAELDGAVPSGDTANLAGVPAADSQSVRELVEEGNAFEAGIVRGVEEARNPEEGGVTTSETPADAVPLEYLEQEQPGRG